MKEISSLDGGTAKKTKGKESFTPALKKSGKTDLRPVYAFLATLLLYFLAMILYKRYPLGDRSLLISDLKAQYAPFLALLRSKIADIRNVPDGHLLSYISYSFELGLGKNFIGTFGYYLASPFSLLYFLFDVTQADSAVLLIVVLKLCFASAFMTMFLGKRSGIRESLWPVLLGIMYAFSLYSQAFIFHIMWLDGYMLLPLILFFTEKFISEQKYTGLVISLLVLFVSNYYIAYMAGISCFLYLCIRMVTEKIEFKKALGICVRYVLTAFFTALITAVMLVPVGLDTIGNADQTGSGGSDLITYTPFVLIHMLTMGESEEFNDLLSANYPFLFICLPVVLLCLVYFLSPLFKCRERKVHAFCFLGVLLSTALYPLDKAWHIFDDPNWFWHRQAFVFLPLFLVVSQKVILRLKDVARKDITKAMLIMYLLVILDYSFGGFKDDSEAVIYNMTLITVYSGFFAGYGITKWPDQLRDMPKMLSPLLSAIICFELVFAGPAMTSGIETIMMSGGSAKEYIESLKAEQDFGEYVKERNTKTGAFRAETEKIIDYTGKNYVRRGESFYGDYNGISFFNSNSNKKLHKFMNQLGVQTNYNYFACWHVFACPSVDSFFSVGSVSARGDLSFYRLESSDSVGTGLGFYANDDFLPLAFAADRRAMNFDFYRLENEVVCKDYFALQNEWYRSMFPDEFADGFFTEIGADVIGEPEITNGVFFNSSEYISHKDLIEEEEVSDTDVLSENDDLDSDDTLDKDLKANMTNIYRINKKIPIVVEYEFKAPSDDEIYCSIATGDIIDGTKIYVNGVKAYDLDSNTFHSQIFRLGKFNEGDDVKVTFMSKEDKWSYLNLGFATFDNEKFSSQIRNVDRTKVSTETAIDGYVKLGINGLESDDIVVTTIPAEKGWQLYIDGVPAEYNVYQDAFIAFNAPAGTHTAELVFTAPGLKAGACVSCAGVVLLAAFILIDKKRAKKVKQK